MKQSLRLALPPLASLTPDTPIPFALFDRGGSIRRSGTLPASQLATLAPGRRAQAILHPGEAVVTVVDLPPVPARRLDAAVQGRIEPMALEPLGELCVAHGPQTADGTVQAAWVSRRLLLKAWQMLHDAGLKLDAIVPFELALPQGDPTPHAPLELPADDRWRAPLPAWSLARAQWRPAARHSRWRAPLAWAAAALGLWLAGLNLYAVQLRGEARALQVRNEQAVREAFPEIPVIIDPLRQARNQYDMLRAGQGMTAHDDFMPVALDAAQVLSFAAGHVAALHYHDGRLRLELAPGYTPPADEAALTRAAAAQALDVRKDSDAANVWIVERAVTGSPKEAHR